MKTRTRHAGFSLTEVLIALGTMAIGMIFVGGVFPTAIYLTTVASERTIAAIAADEAFAKIKLIAADPNSNYTIYANDFVNNEQTDFIETVINKRGTDIIRDEFAYPSDPGIDITQKRYFWSALCKRTGLDSAQVTVFVCRRSGAGSRYYNSTGTGTQPWPVAVPVGVSGAIGTRGGSG